MVTEQLTRSASGERSHTQRENASATASVKACQTAVKKKMIVIVPCEEESLLKIVVWPSSMRHRVNARCYGLGKCMRRTDAAISKHGQLATGGKSEQTSAQTRTNELQPTPRSGKLIPSLTCKASPGRGCLVCALARLL
eukprot:6194436-Pleurochrysis_carterae.AAC.1